MKLLVACCVLFLATAQVISLENEASSDEKELKIKKQLEELDKIVKTGIKQLESEKFQSSDENEDARTEILEKTLQMLNATRSVVEALRYISPEDIKNDITRRQCMRLNNSVIMQDNSDFMKFQIMEDDFAGILERPLVRAYGDKEKLVSYIPDVARILSSSSDPEELKYYWIEWRWDQRVSRHVFNKLVSLYRESSKMQPDREPSSQYYHNYETPNFFNDIENLISDFKPLYEEIHAYLRTSVKFWYNDGKPLDDDKIPHHLIDHTLKIMRDQNPIFKKMENIIEEKNLTASKVAKLAEEFFTSLSMPEFDNDQWTKHTEIRLDDEFCSPRSSNGYLSLCSVVNMRNFLKTFDAVGRVHYIKYKNDLPVGISAEPCRGFLDGISKAIQLSVSTPKYLKKIGLITDYNFDEVLVESYLKRLAFDTIFNLPMHFVNEKFITESLDGKIDNKTSNCIYWKTMEKYAGLKHPDKFINGGGFDVPRQFYKDVMSNYQTKTIFGEVAGYQIYKAWCKKISPDENWRNCDISGNVEIGKMLINVLKKRATVPWQDLMEELTGSRSLSMDALLDFYDPLLKSLKEKNKEQGSVPGWEFRSEDVLNKCNVTESSNNPESDEI